MSRHHLPHSAIAGVAALGLATGLCFAARAVQHTLAYRPSRTPLAPAAAILPAATDITLTTRDGLALRAWFVPPCPGSPQRGQAALLTHGNGDALTERARLGAELARRGFAVLMVGYRGYSGNPGTPSEKGLVLDALAGQQELAARGFPPDRTIYVGESVGAGVAAGLAAQVPSAGVVLRSPFSAFEDVARHLVPLPRPLVRFILNHNMYPVAAQVAASDVPVTVIQGSADTVVPPAQSDAVASAARNLFEHVVVEGAGHNDEVWLGPAVADAVARLGDHVAG